MSYQSCVLSHGAEDRFPCEEIRPWPMLESTDVTRLLCSSHASLFPGAGMRCCFHCFYVDRITVDRITSITA